MNIRIDEDTHRRLKKFASQVGISSSSLINANIKQMLRSRQVTYGTNLEPTPYLQKLIKEAEADHKAGRNITTIKTPSELKEFLD